MVPVGVPQVGWIMLDVVGIAGGVGVLSVTVEAAALTHVLSEMLRTVRVYVAGARPENVGLA